MKSTLNIKIKLANESISLEELTSILYSLYINRIEKTTKRFTYSMPQLASGYAASAIGKFNSELQTTIVHEKDYREYGSKGGFSFYKNSFKVDDARFEIITEHTDYLISIECPSEDLHFIYEFNKNFKEENLYIKSTFKINETSLKKRLTYKYFLLVLENVKYLSEAFELSKNYNDPVLTVNKENRKEVIFSSVDGITHLKVIFWREFQPNINRNYSGLIVEINQTKNQKIAENFNFHFHHHDSHAIGQIDLTVDCCTLVVEEIFDKLKMQMIEIAFRTYLLGLGAI